MEFSEFLENGEDLSDFSVGSKKDLYFLRVEQKYLKSINIGTLRENWSLISSEVNLFTYWNFIKNTTHMPNFHRDHHDIKIIKPTDKKIDIIKRKTDKQLFSIETDEDILFVLTADERGIFFKNNLLQTFHFLDKDIVIYFSILFLKDAIIYKFFRSKSSFFKVRRSTRKTSGFLIRQKMSLDQV